MTAVLKDELAEQLDPHTAAWAERQKAPFLYEDPTLSTPGKLSNLEGLGREGSTALVDPDAPSDLDASVDNRDQVQELLNKADEEVEERAQEMVDAKDVEPTEIDARSVGVPYQTTSPGDIKKPQARPRRQTTETPAVEKKT